MVKYLLVVVGGLIFLAGYSFMKKNEGSGKTMRIYALFAYAGLSLSMFCNRSRSFIKTCF